MRAAGLVLAAPAALGLLAAHALAYRLAGPDAAAGHSYLAYAPAVLGPLAAVGLAQLGLRALGRVGRRSAPPSLRFALLPPLVFVLQEHLERLLHTGRFPVELAAEPVFLTGLGLQVPFAVAAWLLARELLAGADALAGTLRPAVAVPAPLGLPPSPARQAPPPAALVDLRRGRSPPAAAAAR